MARGFNDPPQQGVIFDSDPYPYLRQPIPPGYTYPPMFPGGDPMGIPPPPPGVPSQLPVKQIGVAPVPGGGLGSSNMLLVGGLVIGIFLLMRKK